MRARLLKFIQSLSDAFWLLPATIVLLLSGLGVLAVDVQLLGALPDWIPSGWIYGGGETGARTLLGAVASSTIGVAGTLFSITIAALTLASSQMGPRLLRNFMRDRGNQVTLGVLLGTFTYSLVVLRSVRGGDEDAFVPALGVTLALALSAACVALLIYFIHHVATRINVDTVIDLVHDDLVSDIARLTFADPPPGRTDSIDWSQGAEVRLSGSGYLQQIDTGALVAWAEDHLTTIRLLVGPGAFIVPGAVVALTWPPADGAEDCLRSATALSSQPGASGDLTYSAMQLVEVAVRALSPGINDPRTAISVLDRLGACLARLAGRHLRAGNYPRAGEVRLFVREPTYGEIAEAMFEMIRQSAGRSPVVLVHLIQTLRKVASVETDPDRRDCLRRQAELAVAEGRPLFTNPHDLAALEAAYQAMLADMASDSDASAID